MDSASRIGFLLAELIKSVLKVDQTPDKIYDKSWRLLRSVTNDVNSGEHTFAIRKKLKESFMLQANHIGDGPQKLSLLEKELDNLRKTNPRISHPFLALFEPLSFLKNSNGFDLKIFPNDSMNLGIENKIIAGNGPHISNVSDVETQLPHPPNFKDNDFYLNEYVSWISKETETVLLRDLLFVFQGIGGKHIKFDARCDGYVIDPILSVTHPVRDIVLSLCEIGWLYGKVDAYSKRTESKESMGLVAQAFGYAIQEQLHDYYRLLTVLEQEVSFRQSRIAKSLDVAQSQIQGEEGQITVESNLSLIKLKIWMQDPLDRMVLLARLVEAAGPLSGGALSSRLHGHSRHGDIALSSLVKDSLMSPVCAPIYHMITRWMLHGEVLDPYQEFFIASNPTTSEDTLWQEAYSLRPSMLPSFIPLALAGKILVIGKSINFIRACALRGKELVSTPHEYLDGNKLSRDSNGISSSSGSAYKVDHRRGSRSRDSISGTRSNKGLENSEDGEGVSSVGITTATTTTMSESKEAVRGSPAAAAAAAPSAANPPSGGREVADIEAILDASSVHALETLRYGGEQALSEVVSRVSLATDSSLLQLMLLKFHLKTHLLALKKFMLLGQGDFIICLMDSLAPELKKRATQLFRHNLTGILEGALRSSNAQFEPAYVLDRIGVTLLEAAPGDTGWDVFSLDYTVDAPLTAVVHKEAQKAYRMAFHMLWRLKRVEWSLSAAWKQLMCFAHSGGMDALPRLKPVLHRCTLQRGRMSHFVSNLSAYLMFEVTESAWSVLQTALLSAKCLDDVIAAHDAYLGEIQDRSLLALQHEPLYMQVQQVLQAVLRYCHLEDTLIADALTSVARRRARQHQAQHKESLAARGDWGSMTSIGSAFSGMSLATGTGTGGMAFEDNTLLTLADAPDSVEGVPGYLITRLEDAARDYGIQFAKLMFTLREESERAGESLRFLTFRLDFNDFHLHALSGQEVMMTVMGTAGGGGGGGGAGGMGAAAGSGGNSYSRRYSHLSGGTGASSDIVNKEFDLNRSSTVYDSERQRQQQRFENSATNDSNISGSYNQFRASVVGYNNTLESHQDINTTRGTARSDRLVSQDVEGRMTGSGSSAAAAAMIGSRYDSNGRYLK